MPHSEPKKQWEIPVVAVDQPHDFAKHKRIVQKLIEGFTEPERKIIADKMRTKVEITDQLPDGNMAAYWNKETGVVRLSTTKPTHIKHPKCMEPLLTNFTYLAAHEMHHPLIHAIENHARQHDQAFRRFRRQAQVALHKDKEIGKKIDEVRAAMHRASIYHAPAEDALKIDFGWKKLDTHSREQLGVMLGVLLSEEYHEAYAYTPNFIRNRMFDASYEEVLCNVKALAHVFGEDHVREFAGGLLDYIEKLNPHRANPQNSASLVRKDAAHTHKRVRSYDSGGVGV